MPNFNLGDYVDVQTRIARFWSEYPDGAIRTALASPAEDFTQCRYRAEVYKDRAAAYPDAVGYAFEVAGGRGPNSTSHEENCETSAIGRALANMGYATSGKERPSRQEMTKAASPPARKPEPVRDEPPAPNQSPEWKRASARLHKVAADRGIKHEQLSDWAYIKHGMAKSLTQVDAHALTQLADALEKGGPQAVAAFNEKYPGVDDATQPRLTDADEAVIANYERLGE